MSLKNLAESALSKFVRKTRNNGTEFWSVEGDIRNTDEWVTDMCREAHGSMMPDDWKYEFIHDALTMIAGSLSRYDADDLRSELDVEADIYTADLLQWLASNLERVGYCDEAAKEYEIPADADLVHRITWGQLQERREVLHSVIASLESRERELSDDE